MIYLKTYENYNTKYKQLDIEQFNNLLKENCKNFSLTNDQLFRSDKLYGGYFLHFDMDLNVGQILLAFLYL